MSKNKKKLPSTGRMPERMQRHKQIARVEVIRPKKKNKFQCRNNKGRNEREEY